MVEVATAVRHLEAVRGAVDAGLGAWLERKLHCAEEIDPALGPVVLSVRDLTLRGGKRMRPALLDAGHRMVTPGTPPSKLLHAAMGMEIFQTYLLIHDDWMDGDLMRRSGPTVHVDLERRYKDPHVAASVAVLAGDLACAYATELIAGCGFAAERVQAALRLFALVHADVVLGQSLDVLATGDVDTVHRLKTAAYTVTGPLCIGAALGGASDAQLKALADIGDPLGIAFQLRDDVLGTFGDPGQTGKAAGNDLRAGKRTAVVVAAEDRLDTDGRQLLERVLGDPSAADADIEALRERMRAADVHGVIGARLDALVDRAEAALQSGPFEPDGVELLQGYAALLIRRAH